MENLKRLREKYDISQKQLAEHLHCSQTLISKWEKGLREPNFEILRQTAKFFDCSIDYLLNYELEDEAENYFNERLQSTYLTDEQKQCYEILKNMTPKQVERTYYFMLGVTGQKINYEN